MTARVTFPMSIVSSYFGCFYIICFFIFQEVLEHGDVKIMEEQLANAIESIVVSIKMYIISNIL